MYIPALSLSRHFSHPIFPFPVGVRGLYIRCASKRTDKSICQGNPLYDIHCNKAGLSRPPSGMGVYRKLLALPYLALVLIVPRSPSVYKVVVDGLGAGGALFSLYWLKRGVQISNKNFVINDQPNHGIWLVFLICDFN